MIYSVIAPQGWKMDLVGIESPSKAFETMSDFAIEAEKLGYDTVWLFDHFHTVPKPSQETTFECWTSTAALARDTHKIKIGQMVTCNNYRNPSLLAKMASTVDVMSKGRLRFGLGAGWYQQEYEAYGYDFAKTPVRLKQLHEALEIIIQMWTTNEANYDGVFYRVKGAINQPKGIQKPHIPIMVGGGGEKVTLKLVAKYAQASNLGFMDPQTIKRKLYILDQHCQNVGTDYRHILKTVLLNCSIDNDENKANARAKNDPNFARNAGGEEYITERSLIGTPRQIKQRIKEYEEAGIQEMIIYFPQDNRNESLRLFRDQIIHS